MLHFLSRLIPDQLNLLLRGMFSLVIGFRLVKDWADGVEKSSGYESKATLKTMFSSDANVVNNIPHGEFVNRRYQQVASAFLEGLPDQTRTSEISVLDVGGGLGDYFFFFKRYAPNLRLKWVVVETSSVCKIANASVLSDSNISWTDSIHKVEDDFDIVLMSGVIQCVEHPFVLLQDAIQRGKFLIINRTPLTKYDKNLVCVLRPGIFETKGSFPVQLLSETELIRHLRSQGEILSRWMVPEDDAVVRFKRIVHQALTFLPNQRAAI
jgi:hypothetical protein